MKIVIVLLLLLCSINMVFAADFRMINTKNGRDVSLQDMARVLSKSQVIFFGEFHDNPVVHKLQIDLLPHLLSPKTPLVLSFEMFERDVQPYLDMYLGGEMSEADFMLNSRPWPNYVTDYKPPVDFAREHELKVIAANVPRYLAGRSVRNPESFTQTLSDQEKTYVATSVSAPDDRYKELFMQTMQINTAHGMPGDISIFEKLYYAQCLKDDTMAESIALALQENKKSKIVHFNGDFHSKYYLGTVQRLVQRVPKLKVAVISPLYVKDPGTYRWQKQDRQMADFLILLPNENPEEELQ